MWRHTTRGKGRAFFEGLRTVLSTLQPKRAFLEELVAGGAKLTLIINLPGDVNMGDVAEPETLQAISDLGLELGVEVFPKMK